MTSLVEWPSQFLRLSINVDKSLACQKESYKLGERKENIYNFKWIFR